MYEEEIKERIGPMYKGQAWVELHGTFTVDELIALVNKIEENCRGLDRGNPK